MKKHEKLPVKPEKTGDFFSLPRNASALCMIFFSSLSDERLDKMASAFEKQLKLHPTRVDLIEVLGYITCVKRERSNK